MTGLVGGAALLSLAGYLASFVGWIALVVLAFRSSKRAGALSLIPFYAMFFAAKRSDSSRRWLWLGLMVGGFVVGYAAQLVAVANVTVE